MTALVALLLLTSQTPPSDEAKAAAAAAVEIVDGWVSQAAKLEEKLQKALKLQELLDAAVQSRDAGKLRDAIAAWSPSTAGKLTTVAEIEAELRRLNPSSVAGGTLDEALVFFAGNARDLNRRALPGLPGKVERAQVCLGRAIELGLKIKLTWDGTKEPGERYDEVIKDIEDRFDPAARDAAAELRSIEPGAVALQALEARLWEQARQMSLLRPIDAPKDSVAAELRRRFPDDGTLPLTEIRTPEFLKGRFFHVRNDRYYLFTAEGALHPMKGTLETIRRVARVAKKPVDPESFASELPEFETRFQRAVEEFGPSIDACREPRAIIEAYLNLHDPAAARKAIEDVSRVQGRGFEEAIARAMFDEADRGVLKKLGQILRSNVIVEVSVSGDGFDISRASLWARTEDGAPTALQRGAALVPVDPARHGAIFIGGAQGGDAYRETMARLPRLPARVTATLPFAFRPRDASSESSPAIGPADIDHFVKLNAGGSKAPPSFEDSPLSAAEKEEMKVRAGIDTDPGSPPDETAAKFGARPTDLGDGGFGGLLEKLLAGDRSGAEGIYQRITACTAERARKDIDRLLGEDKTRKGNEEKGKSARVPYEGPRPGPDADYLKAAGVSPADVAVPVDPSVIPDAPRPDDLRPPPEQPAAGNPFDSYRRAAAALPSDFHRRQQSAVDGERRAALGVIRDRTMATRGGMDNFDAGAAKTVVLTVWQPGAEDGDIVRISVGGRVVAPALTVTNAPQSFTIDLTEPFTPITVVALNEGGSSPNAAGIKVSAGGRDLRVSSWTLKANGVASSVIRRGGGP